MEMDKYDSDFDSESESPLDKKQTYESSGAHANGLISHRENETISHWRSDTTQFPPETDVKDSTGGSEGR
ncbi:hypothetical protein EVAR_61367_1 [Eumeta japonica]|uniref:Uncharacterized protein n=1 Tax=Eumeta variegata TaxID=151549 RepID=A0A4C1Z785_EUMVA|nr:hypothetical protein EVAR_61367_1 [Eumeta japonica]